MYHLASGLMLVSLRHRELPTYSIRRYADGLDVHDFGFTAYEDGSGAEGCSWASFSAHHQDQRKRNPEAISGLMCPDTDLFGFVYRMFCMSYCWSMTRS
jgi:hypothetical protein